jgi:uncharacterized protein YjdB
MHTKSIPVLAFAALSLMACGPEDLEGLDPVASELVLARRTNALTEPGNILTGGDRYTHPYYASGGNCVFETTLGTLQDSVLWLYGPNSSTNLIAYDDDGGNGLASRIQRHLQPGTYYATVAGYNSSQTGTYEISMNCYAAVRYQAYAANLGWLGWGYDGFVAGTTGQSRQMEAVQLMLSNMPGTSIRYTVHVAEVGWMGEFYDGQVAGTTGQNRRMEAISIWLSNAPAGCGISYNAHLADIGWQGVRSNGEIAGTTYQNRRMEALQVWLTGNCN